MFRENIKTPVKAFGLNEYKELIQGLINAKFQEIDHRLETVGGYGVVDSLNYFKMELTKQLSEDIEKDTFNGLVGEVQESSHIGEPFDPQYYKDAEMYKERIQDAIAFGYPLESQKYDGSEFHLSEHKDEIQEWMMKSVDDKIKEIHKYNEKTTTKDEARKPISERKEHYKKMEKAQTNRYKSTDIER